MKLTYIEKLLFEGALKANRSAIKILFFLSEVVLIIITIIFFTLYIVRGQDILFTDGLITLLGAILVFTIHVYQKIIQKIQQK